MLLNDVFSFLSAGLKVKSVSFIQLFFQLLQSIDCFKYIFDEWSQSSLTPASLMCIHSALFPPFMTVSWISLSCGQNRTFEDVPAGFGKHWSTFFPIFWHLIEQTTYWLIEKMIPKMKWGGLTVTPFNDPRKKTSSRTVRHEIDILTYDFHHRHFILYHFVRPHLQYCHVDSTCHASELNFRSGPKCPQSIPLIPVTQCCLCFQLSVFHEELHFYEVKGSL